MQGSSQSQWCYCHIQLPINQVLFEVLQLSASTATCSIAEPDWLHVLQVGPRFEVVVFTASLAKYADPLLDLMDKAGLVRWRLFRESCCPYEGNYVKDLNCLGRDLSSTIIVDNSPHSYIFQPANAVPIGTFIDDMEDQELLELLPQLLQVGELD